jgi:hypothetical protein
MTFFSYTQIPKIRLFSLQAKSHCFFFELKNMEQYKHITDKAFINIDIVNKHQKSH